MYILQNYVKDLKLHKHFLNLSHKYNEQNF